MNLLNDTPDNIITNITNELCTIYETLNTDRIGLVHINVDLFKDSVAIERICEQEDIHPQVKKLLRIPQYKQRSPEWFEQRACKLTSSDVDSVLGNNKYSCYDEVLFKKCGIKKPFTGNEATEHGQKYEDEAIDLYCKLYNKKTFSFGLLPHPSIDFLAGSPDDITYDGIVLEVKCPFRRKIIMGEVPLQYQAQIRMNMDICGLDKGVFIEYRPAVLCEDNQYILNVVEFERDPKWFEETLPKLQSFWNDVLRYRENDNIKSHPRYNRFYRLANPPPKIKEGRRMCSVSASRFEDSDSDTDNDEGIELN